MKYAIYSFKGFAYELQDKLRTENIITDLPETGSFLPESWRDGERFSQEKFIDWLTQSHDRPTMA